MKKPIGKIDKYLETQRMYNSIKEQIIECYELEQRSEYLDALRIIDCGLGSYALSNLKVQSSILGKINLLESKIGNKVINSGGDDVRVFDSIQNNAIKIIERFENEYNNRKISGKKL